MSNFIFGIDLGGTTVKCGLFTENGDLLEKWEIPTDTTNKGANIPKDIANTILEKMQEKSIPAEEVLGVGMGIPGPVFSKGIVAGCANLGWGRMNIAEVMTDLTGLNFIPGNDANVAALGEMWKGGGRGYDNVVMITLGTGVGGGIIVDGKIIPGAFGCGGEIGHIVVNNAETAVCGCGGHGHLEQYASATGVVRLANLELESSNEVSSLREIEKITAKDVFDAAKAGDALALKVVDRYGWYLAMALGHVASTVDPEIFVIGGGMAKAGQIIIDAVEKYYGKNLLGSLRERKFALAELGNDAGIFGSAKLVLTSLEK